MRTGIGWYPAGGVGSNDLALIRTDGSTALSAKGFGSWIIEAFTASSRVRRSRHNSTPRSMFAGFRIGSCGGARIPTVPWSPFNSGGLSRCLPSGPANTTSDIRWGHVLTGFDQHDDGVTVHVAGPDGAYHLTANYLVGADGGTSKTRHLAGIEFPGMSSYDLVVRHGVRRTAAGRMGRSGQRDARRTRVRSPPPLRFHRTEQGVFAYGALGSRIAVMTYELDRSAREERRDDATDGLPMSLAELEASAKRVLGADAPLRPASPDAPLDLRRFSGINSRIASRYQVGRVILVGDAAHVHSPIGGPGLNLGLQDAVNLGWKLAAVLVGAWSPRCSQPMRPSVGRLPSGSSRRAGPSWLSSDRGLKSPRCANCSPNWSPIPLTSVASAT